VGLADRIAVMYRGKILAIVSPETPREELGLLMAGITEPTATPEPAAEPEPAPRAGDAEKGTE